MFLAIIAEAWFTQEPNKHWSFTKKNEIIKKAEEDLQTIWFSLILLQKTEAWSGPNLPFPNHM